LEENGQVNALAQSQTQVNLLRQQKEFDEHSTAVRESTKRMVEAQELLFQEALRATECMRARMPSPNGKGTSLVDAHSVLNKLMEAQTELLEEKKRTLELTRELAAERAQNKRARTEKGSQDKFQHLNPEASSGLQISPTALRLSKKFTPASSIISINQSATIQVAPNSTISTHVNAPTQAHSSSTISNAMGNSRGAPSNSTISNAMSNSSGAPSHSTKSTPVDTSMHVLQFKRPATAVQRHQRTELQVDLSVGHWKQALQSRGLYLPENPPGRDGHESSIRRLRGAMKNHTDAWRHKRPQDNIHWDKHQEYEKMQNVYRIPSMYADPNTWLEGHRATNRLLSTSPLRVSVVVLRPIGERHAWIRARFLKTMAPRVKPSIGQQGSHLTPAVNLDANATQPGG
jgi:hypothetical protein